MVARLSAFKCRVLVHDPMVTEADIQRSGASSVSLAQLLAGSDIVSLHCPSTPATRHLIGTASLAAMRPGALLVNVARGDLVDTGALIEELQSGHLGAAALDVFDPEPLPLGHALRNLPNVVVAPHIASVSVTAVQALREGAISRAVAAVRGRLPDNVVNQIALPRVVQ